MPEISPFFGMYRDHRPPHFHARYGGRVAEAALDTLAVGSLGSVMAWAAPHRDEPLANWERARRSEPLAAVSPLWWAGWTVAAGSTWFRRSRLSRAGSGRSSLRRVHGGDRS